MSLHPAVVHFPIALLILASVSGLAYMHWQPREELKVLTWWSLLPGWLALFVAIVTGLFAQGALPPDAPYRSTLNRHITTGLLLVLIYGELLYRRWVRRPRRRRKGSHIRPATETAGDLLDDARRRWLLTAQLVLGIALVISTGWFGGELVYTWGVNVGR